MLLKELKLVESSKTMFQVRVENSDWQDLALPFKDLQAIVDEINTVWVPDGGDVGDLGVLTGLVQDYIGEGPNSRGENRGSWDEIEFDLKTFKDDVLKIKYTFGGVDMGRLEGKYGTPVTKKGTITIMPGN